MMNIYRRLSPCNKSVRVLAVLVFGLLSLPAIAVGAQKFHATVVDTEGVKSEVKNFRFYYEERLNDTSFVPHELQHVPVKKGASTINVQFSSIKEIRINSNGKAPELTIHLANGKSGKFPLGIDGKFRGDSDFGEIDFPPSGIKSITLKK